jgi:hypothetical protein
MSFKDFIPEIHDTTTLNEWMLREATTASRFAVDVNYRTETKEVAKNFAKIALGYVSAALKQNGYHTKHVYDVDPVRLMVSSRNWDDGEWIVEVHFHPDYEGGSFVVCKGFYNKDRKSASIVSQKKSEGTSAAAIALELRTMLNELKNQPDRHQEKLRPVRLKTGPKPF